MKTSLKGLELIKSFEGCKLQAYKALPSEKYFTIGYGHYGADVHPGMVISQSNADALLKKDLEKFESKVNKYSTYTWTQNEFDALVSFAYNVGSIDQLTANGTRTKKQISDKFMAYNKSGGNVIAGLTRRRKAEKEMFDGSNKSSRLVLKKGAVGSYVIELQTLLSRKGFACGKIDGYFGVLTQTAVIGFQGSNGLTKDGVVGPATWAELLK